MADKEQLLRYLEHHVFDPILHASPGKYSQADQKRLRDAQDRTRTEKERFRNYKDAKEVIENFKRDVHSTAAKRVNAELEHLKLPTLPSVKDDFLKHAED